MTMPRRYQRKRTGGWRMPPETVYVGRPSRWGNPYKVGTDGTAAACVRLFEARFQEDAAYQDAGRRELAGKNVLCWWKPGDHCHADVLLRWAASARTPGGHTR